MESFKRKAMESSQTAADLQLHLEKYHSQLREVQVAVTDKTTSLEQQSFKYRRIVVSWDTYSPRCSWRRFDTQISLVKL